MKKPSVKTPLVLVILDGFGMADPAQAGNAITPATAPHIFSYWEKYPSTTLTAHGRDVGLFPGQEGNSEAGHFNIGAGRVVEQDTVRISRAIKDGTFFKNEALLETLRQTPAKKAVHLVGLLTNGQSAHAHPEHVYALLDLMRRHKRERVFLHLFTDGRDSSPHSAISHLRKLRKYMLGHEQIASISGRFYAMDRNKIWSRTQAAYEAMVLGHATYAAHTTEEAITQAYDRGETDEYITPTVIVKNNQPIGTIADSDAVFFFNSRSDRARQLAKALVQPNFSKLNPGAFKRLRWPKLHVCALTDFGPDLNGMRVACPAPDLLHCLPQAIGESYRQLYISETEKYAHVTYFINGGYSSPVNGEVRELVASGTTRSYATKPAMHSKQVADRVLDHLAKQAYDGIVVNFPNADMVGHTGNVAAAKKAVKAVDQQVARLVKAVQKHGGQVIITADHGNAEAMVNPGNGDLKTEHTTSPVPFIIVNDELAHMHLRSGRLADVAPTMLALLGLHKPKEMTGKILF